MTQYPPRDWERIQKIGLTPQITTAKEYAKQVMMGMRLASAAFSLKNELVPSEDTIKGIHFIAFESVHPWAGKFREPGQEVQAGKLVCTDSADIVNELGILRREMLGNPLTGTRKYLSEVLSFYHASFLAIHPFLDGNGRLARVILDRQCKTLLGHPLTFKFSRAEYVEALERAQQEGDLTLLAKIVGTREHDRLITVDSPAKLSKKGEDARNKSISVSDLKKKEKELLTLRRKLGFIGSEIDAQYGLGGYPAALTTKDARSKAEVIIASKAYKGDKTAEALALELLETDRKLGHNRAAVSREIIAIQEALLKKKERERKGQSLRKKR